MDMILIALLTVVSALLSMYTWILIIYVVLSWLMYFNVVNSYNRFIEIVSRMTSAFVEPLLGRIRQVMPLLGGVDLSPLILFFAIYFLQILMAQAMMKLV